jgi:hypothetical protein
LLHIVGIKYFIVTTEQKVHEQTGGTKKKKFQHEGGSRKMSKKTKTLNFFYRLNHPPYLASCKKTGKNITSCEQRKKKFI